MLCALPAAPPGDPSDGISARLGATGTVAGHADSGLLFSDKSQHWLKFIWQGRASLKQYSKRRLLNQSL